MLLNLCFMNLLPILYQKESFYRKRFVKEYFLIFLYNFHNIYLITIMHLLWILGFLLILLQSVKTSIIVYSSLFFTSDNTKCDRNNWCFSFKLLFKKVWIEMGKINSGTKRKMCQKIKTWHFSFAENNFFLVFINYPSEKWVKES